VRRLLHHPTRTLATLGVLASGLALAQPAFEAATIKPDTSSAPESGGFEHGRLTLRNATLRHLVGAAYNVRIDLLRGGPKWVDTDRFDVTAKADPTTSEETSRIMLQTLLAERFKLVIRHQQTPMPVFLLTVDKHGPKFHESPADSTERAGCVGTAPLNCHKRSMADLADALRRYATGLDLPVVDGTGLEGRYDFQLSFAETAGSGAPLIFDALREQLGLKLQKAKRPIDFLVIDRAEPLSPEN
jgi:uncharacterized protein (TIGR03435 family)